MKKRVVIFVLVMAMAVTLFAGCEYPGAETENITEGDYSLFKTTEREEYFEFLENFDETKYEILDISTSMVGNRGGYHGSDEFYMVTYKAIK